MPEAIAFGMMVACYAMATVPFWVGVSSPEYKTISWWIGTCCGMVLFITFLVVIGMVQ